MRERPKPVRKLQLAAAILLFVTLVAACGDDESAGVDSGSNGNGPVVAHPDEGNGDAMQALIEGTLTLSKGCLLVGEYPVIWPHGTTWDAESQAVELSDGQVIAGGDRVRGGGGYPYLSDLHAHFAEPLADCPTNKWGEIAVFNADEQVTVIE
ncbi:hypothetical protein [Nocardioides sp. SR21]|uniref:hypothetical protein n=1 Tax=Nocardioides sp. SR21 TaxID=2919501 RepID=UPI001FAB350C|nr:hypothetical protein [Nocardioides sp. SR21]